MITRKIPVISGGIIKDNITVTASIDNINCFFKNNVHQDNP